MTRLITASAAAAVLVAGLHAADDRPRFEVASVKSCGPADPGFRGGGPSKFSPDRVAINCQILKGLIQQAYIAHKDGGTEQDAVLRTPIENGPDWISAERYSIDAKTPVEAGQARIMGPYLQTLLEDRFKLKIRRLTREIPTWDLVIAKGGPKLTPFQEGSCVRTAAAFPPAAPTLAPGERRCRNQVQFKGTSVVTDEEGATLADLAKLSLLLASGRPVNDKTGLTGRFNIHLEYAPPEDARVNGQRIDAAEVTAPSIFTAVQEQLGLRLESSKGPGEYLVIDHVERPTED